MSKLSDSSGATFTSSPNIYCVYKHTTPSGKMYIGITRDTKKRWASNGAGYREQPKFYHAIKKYGWDNISHEIIESGLSVEDAVALEQHYIALYDTIRHGYNVSPGGLAPMVNGVRVDQYTVEGMFVSTYPTAKDGAIAVGGDSGQHILQVCRGERWLAYDYVWCFAGEEPRVPPEDLISRSGDAVRIKNAGSVSRTVLQFDMDGKFIRSFPSAAEAARTNDLAVSSIINVCDQFSISGGGYRWMYEDEPYQFRDRDKYQSKRVRCIETDEVFASTTDAGRALGIDRWCISLNCQCKTRHAGKLHFEFVDPSKPMQKAVIVYTKDGQYLRRFDTQQEAAKWCGLSKSTVSKGCINPFKKVAKDYMFRFADEVEDYENAV